MKIVIQRALKPLGDIDHPREASRLQRLTGKDRAAAAAADQQYRARQVTLDQTRNLLGKIRINLPIRGLLPSHVFGTNRVTDVHMFDFSPAIDQNSLGKLLQELMGGEWVKVLHGVGKNENRAILCFNPGLPYAAFYFRSTHEIARLARRPVRCLSPHLKKLTSWSISI